MPSTGPVSVATSTRRIGTRGGKSRRPSAPNVGACASRPWISTHGTNYSAVSTEFRMLDRRGQLLRAAVGFAGCSLPSYRQLRLGIGASASRTPLQTCHALYDVGYSHFPTRIN